jgi:hypothetical protein
MSNKDFDRLMDTLGAKTAKAFKEQITAYASGKYNILKNTYQGVLNDPMVKSWERSTNVPFWSGTFMEQTGIRSPQDWYESLTDNGKIGFDYFIGNGSNVTQAPVTPDSTGKSPQFKYIDGAFHRVD